MKQDIQTLDLKDIDSSTAVSTMEYLLPYPSLLPTLFIGLDPVLKVLKRRLTKVYRCLSICTQNEPFEPDPPEKPISVFEELQRNRPYPLGMPRTDEGEVRKGDKQKEQNDDKDAGDKHSNPTPALGDISPAHRSRDDGNNQRHLERRVQLGDIGQMTRESNTYNKLEEKTLVSSIAPEPVSAAAGDISFGCGNHSSFGAPDIGFGAPSVKRWPAKRRRHRWLWDGHEQLEMEGDNMTSIFGTKRNFVIDSEGCI
ncbi:hypothetical protein RUND412_001965 [Rhizina undulata]